MPSNHFQPEVFEFSLDRSPWDVESAFRRLALLPDTIFFDGSSGSFESDALNRYSFIVADPIDRIVIDKNDEFHIHQLRSILGQYSFNRIHGLPPFQGGLAGLISYGLNGKLESIPAGVPDEFSVPLLAMNVYDTVIAIDRLLGRGWIISQGWPAVDPADRRIRAQQRMKFFSEAVFGSDSIPGKLQELSSDSRFAFPPIGPGSPMNRLDHELELYSDMTAADYMAMVARAIRYIHEGDVFQVNLSQRLLSPACGLASDLYLELRRCSPAPFSAYFDFGTGQVVSASPERLVSIRESVIETRPIKGTRRRTHIPEVDLKMRQELASSEKDRAENIMIVDLMRNDLSGVAEPDSVLVNKLCGVEQFQDVFHLVSVVQAKLRPDFDGFDLLRSVFPGGSITGAPKIRAMEIISELEPSARGAYCGSLGYISPDSEMDFNILIRTITAAGGWWQIPVGGGIVSDSVPQHEYDETITKSIGMLKAVARINASYSLSSHTPNPNTIGVA